MFLKPKRVRKDGKTHTYWVLVESVRTPKKISPLLDMRKWIDRADSVTWGHRSDLQYPPPF